MKGKKEEEKKKKKQIRWLGLAEMCNVKHHRCQLGNLGSGLAPIHNSRRLGRQADPMWIENGVASGPPDRGGGWRGRAAARKAQRLGRARPEQRRARGSGLGWAEGVKERSEGRGRLQSDSSRVPGDLHAKLAEFNELSGRWSFTFYLVILLGEEGGRGLAPVEGARSVE